MKKQDVVEIVEKELSGYIRAASGVSRRSDLSLLELGFDSLMAMSLRNALQEKLGIAIPADAIFGFPPLDEFIDSLFELVTRKPVDSGSKKKPVVEDDNTWRPILFEQAVFHEAYYTFPQAPYNTSISLGAPRRISESALKAAMRAVEAKREVLRSVYRPDATFNVLGTTFVEMAWLGAFDIRGSHVLEGPGPLLDVIKECSRRRINLDEGPAYHYALIHVTNEANETRSVIYLAVNHVVADFRSMNIIAGDLMKLLDGRESTETATNDTYVRAVSMPRVEDVLRHKRDWRRIISVPVTSLDEGVDPARAEIRYFNFADIDLEKLAAILRRNNVTLYNGVYALWILTLSRHFKDLPLDNFPSLTSVSTRHTAELENIVGCLVHFPIVRFHLDKRATMSQLMEEVQRTTTRAFNEIIAKPVEYLERVLADENNLVPFIHRNMIQYRGQQETARPAAGWAVYCNDWFFGRSQDGLYLDFHASARDGSMEGHLLVNLNYATASAVNLILQTLHELLLNVIEEPALQFVPALDVTA